MERRSHLHAVVCLAFVVTLPLRCRTCAGTEMSSGTAIATDAASTLLVLKDGGVLTGTISPTEGGYLVHLDGAVIQVPAAKVFVVCGSLEEAYEARRREITRPSAESHLGLATWCLRYGLLPQAARELVDARGLEPNHPRLALLQRRLAAGEIQSAKQRPKTVEPSDSSAERNPNVLPIASTEGVSDAVVERFTRKVQPILVNNCTMSGCHQRGGTQQFQLDRALLHGLANRRTTMHNLAATLALVDRDQPQLSPLLAIPRQPHGGMRAPVFGPRQAPAFNHLMEWVSLVTRRVPSETEPPSIANSSNEVVLAGNSDAAPTVQHGDEQVAIASTSNDFERSPGAPAKPLVQFGARLQP